MKRNEMDENETVNWNAYEYDFMRFELEEQKIILGFDTGSGTYPSISGTHNGTITPNKTIITTKLYTYSCIERAGTPNMHVSGTKHGTQPQPGTDMPATGITSLSTIPLFFYPTKLTTTPFAQAPTRRFIIIRP